MLKFHPITAFIKMHANFQKKFLIRVFRFKYIFPIKYKIHILDLMFLPKNSVPFEGLYYSRANNLVGADRTARMRRLICAFCCLHATKSRFPQQGTYQMG